MLTDVKTVHPSTKGNMMKTMNALQILALAIFCAAATEACAYFDPTIGRWASRDPIGVTSLRRIEIDAAAQPSAPSATLRTRGSARRLPRRIHFDRLHERHEQHPHADRRALHA